jgi:hypothetical protein
MKIFDRMRHRGRSAEQIHLEQGHRKRATRSNDGLDLNGAMTSVMQRMS